LAKRPPEAAKKLVILQEALMKNYSSAILPKIPPARKNSTFFLDESQYNLILFI